MSQLSVSQQPVSFFDLTRQYGSVREEVDRAIERVVESQGFILGPEVEALEEEVQAHLDVPHAVGCASGTDALLLPLMALEPREGDEVVVPSFTFFATAGAAWNAGFTPVFCDVDPETFNVTAESVEAAVTERTRAIVPVDLFGQMAPVDEIMELAEARGLIVIEDLAQAFGASRGDTMAGAAAHVGSISFFPTKNLGGFGDGGMVTATDEEIAEKVRKLRVHGGRKMYHHEMVGTNSRLDALQAAVLRAKLPRLGGWIEARRRNASIYDEMLRDVSEVITPRVDEGNRHTYNQYTLRARRRDELREHLSDMGVGTGVYYPLPLHMQDCFSSVGLGRGDLPVSEALSEQVISLPIFPELTEEEVRRVADGIRSFYA